LITKEANSKLGVLNGVKVVKINPIRILEMGIYWKIEWRSLATPNTIISKSNVNVPVLASSHLLDDFFPKNFLGKGFCFKK